MSRRACPRAGRAAFAVAALLAVCGRSADAGGVNARDAVGYLGGAYASIGVHELGHAATLKAAGGTDIQIDVPREGCWLCGQTRATPPASGWQPWQAQAIAVSGLVAANLAGEWVVRHTAAHPQMPSSAFGRGLLGASLYSNASHVYTYYTRRVGVDGYQGNDIDAYEAAGGNPHVLSAALVAYTAWTLHRMHKQRLPLFWLNVRF